ncbi:MAG TPA: hypothetical protein DCG34_10250 [Clostridiales bacterium]|jgi:hypothetical protein|nr:hypothetical protein [Clostridiales bacterium]
MKGVLLEKKGHQGIFVTQDGAFVKGKHKDKAIGEEFEIEKLATSYRTYVAVAVVALMLIIGFGPLGVYADPYGYIELDINPSVELAYNRSMKIIKVTPLNDDGKALLDEIDVRLKGNTLDKAVDILLERARILNYDLNNVVIVYTKLDIAEESKIEDVIGQINSTNDTITILDIDKEAYKELKKDNVPPAVTVLKSKLDEMQVDKEEYINVDKVSELAHIMNQAKKAIQAEKRQDKGNGPDTESRQDNQDGPPSNTNKGNSNNNSGGNNSSGNNGGNN